MQRVEDKGKKFSFAICQNTRNILLCKQDNKFIHLVLADLFVKIIGSSPPGLGLSRPVLSIYGHSEYGGKREEG